MSNLSIVKSSNSRFFADNSPIFFCFTGCAYISKQFDSQFSQSWQLCMLLTSFRRDIYIFFQMSRNKAISPNWLSMGLLNNYVTHREWVDISVFGGVAWRKTRGGGLRRSKNIIKRFFVQLWRNKGFINTEH